MTTVDPFLCVGMAILLAVLLVINVYMLIMWQHPDDKVKYIIKIVINLIYDFYI
jgi:hypothetical protein